MAKQKLDIYPYYDYYDKYEKDSGITQLLARPGRVAQAREITQIQSTVKDIIKSVGDSIFRDGNIIEGCEVVPTVVNGIHKVTVTAGKIYLNGMVLPVLETRDINLPTDAEGNVVKNAVVGIKLEERIITSLDVDGKDVLLDPTLGFDNSGNPGCDRLQSFTRVVVYDGDNEVDVQNNNDAATISKLTNGSVSVENSAPDYDNLTKTLARRTYDESGSYIVEGLNVRVDSAPAEYGDDYFQVVVEAGKAYIMGYELRLPSPRRDVVLPRSLEFEPKELKFVTYSNSSNYSKLSDDPYIKSINRVVGTRSKTVTLLIQSGNLGTDTRNAVVVPGNSSDEAFSILRITDISQGSVKYTAAREGRPTNTELEVSESCYLYHDGTNYKLVFPHNSDDLHPEIGSDFTVTYEYTYTFSEGTDYKLEYDAIEDNMGILWLGEGDKPLNNTDISVNYDVYQARKDIIYIDHLGNIQAIQGIPAISGKEIAPEAPVNTLALAVISSPPGGVPLVESSTSPNLRIVSSNIGLTRFTMRDIQRILNRVNILEYDQAIISLNDEAINDNSVSNKKGIWTEPLMDFSKIDFNHERNDIKHDVCIDLDSHICYLPVVSDMYDLTLDLVNSSSEVKKSNRAITLSKLGTMKILSQTSATTSFAVNPYTVYPGSPEISITPSTDIWIDDTIITVPVSLSKDEFTTVEVRNVEKIVRRGRYISSWEETTHEDTRIGTRVDVSTTESVISSEAVTYIRPREIVVEGSHFGLGDVNDIKCSFDGKPVDLVPIAPTVAGSTAGTVSTINGSFRAKFQIPEGVLTGTREVVVSSELLKNQDNQKNSAFALYTASGTLRTIERTVTTLTTILYNRVTTITTIEDLDPVAQTFTLDKMAIVSGINIYFASKPSGESPAPVTCEIREVVDGNITPTVYAHKTLEASNLPSIEEMETSEVPTKFDFDDPVLLEANKEYAFVVRSSSSYYRVWVSELGKEDKITGKTVLSNPYLVGIMMSSSNNRSWTFHQNTDIKFDIYADVYDTSSRVVFDTISRVRNKVEDYNLFDTSTVYNEGDVVNYNSSLYECISNGVVGSWDITQWSHYEIPATPFSRIYLMTESIILDNTSINWSFSTDKGNTFKFITPDNIELLDSSATDIIVRADLENNSGNANITPIIPAEAIGLLLSHYDYDADNPTKGYYYVSKNIPNIGLADEGYTTADIILDTFKPSGTSIEVYISTDGGDTIVPAGDPQSSSTLGYDWDETKYRVSLDRGAKNCRLYIKLMSSSIASTPAFRRVRMILS